MQGRRNFAHSATCGNARQTGGEFIEWHQHIALDAFTGIGLSLAYRRAVRLA